MRRGTFSSAAWARNPQLTGWGAQDTVIISRKPLSDADVVHAREAFQAAGMEVMYVPGDAPANAFGQLLLAKDPLAFERNYQFDITPVSDNRPFFFYTVQPRDIAAYLLQSGGAADAKVNVAVPKLFAGADRQRHCGGDHSAAAAGSAGNEAAA